MASRRSQRERSPSSALSSYSSSSSSSFDEPDNSDINSISDQKLSKLSEMIKLPRKDIVIRGYCRQIGLSDILYDDLFRNPQLVLRPLKDQVKNQKRELNELRAEVEILRAHDQEKSDRIKELNSRKVHNPTTYEESLVYLGVAEGEDFDAIRVRAQMAVQEASNSNEVPAFIVEQAFLKIAEKRGEDDLNMLRETSKSGTKQEIKPESNESKSICNKSAGGSKPDLKKSLKRDHWTDEDGGEDLRDVSKKRLKYFRRE